MDLGKSMPFNEKRVEHLDCGLFVLIINCSLNALPLRMNGEFVNG